MFEHCEHNPFTLTGRPSNHFNSINYAALTKEDGSRKRFISRYENGFLVEIDLSGFHLYLIYMILGQKFPENVYEELNQYYPEEVNPKDFTFKQIYGGIDESLLEIEPFKSIKGLTNGIYEQYKRGTLKTFLFDRPINISGLSPTKLFNYMLQNLETEFNARLLNELNQRLIQKETKLILYTYDSFLFDYSPNDTMQIFKEIIDVFKDVPFRLKVGTNYHEMKSIKI